MNSKIWNHINKIVIAFAVIILCSTHIAYAATGESQIGTSRWKEILNSISKYFNLNTKEEITIEDLKNYLSSGNFTDVEDFNEIVEKIKNMADGKNKDTLLAITDMFSGYVQLEEIDMQELLDTLVNTLLDAIKSLTGNVNIGSIGDILGNVDLSEALNFDIGSLLGIGGSSLPVDAEKNVPKIMSTTAGKFAGDDYKVSLSAKVYLNETKTDKWAVIIHPFLLKGETIANSAVGKYYYENGYNILAPDLRGFGDSEGSVALGCLESMDVYDRIVWLKNESGYAVDEIIIHGVSLGAATTNFISGIDKFLEDENLNLMPLSELGVVGLVEDCGYVRMTDFAGETFLNLLGTGLENKDFDYYSDATNSLKYCELPLLIIHGEADTTVDPLNATKYIPEAMKMNERGGYIYDTVIIDNGVHALIIMGDNDQYREAVEGFIAYVENKDNNKNNADNDETETKDDEEKSIRHTLLEKIKAIFGR